MFQLLTIKQKLTAGFGAIVALVLVLIAAMYLSFGQLSEARRSDRHSIEVMHQSSRIAVAMLHVQTLVRGYMLTGDQNELVPIRSEAAAARQHLKQVLAMTADNAAQQDRLHRLEGMMSEWLTNVAKIEARRLNAGDGSLPGTEQMNTQIYDQILDGSVAMSAMRKLLDEVDSEEVRLRTTREANAESLRKAIVDQMSVGAVLCVVFAAVIAGLLVRAMSRQLSGLLETARRLAAGERGARAAVLSSDEIGMATQELNRMAQSVEDGLAREQAISDALRTKVDALLDVVTRAARGDLTGSVTVRGDDTIGRLGEGVAVMLDNLRRLIGDVQRAGIMVATSSTQIAAFTRQQEATGVEHAQTSIEVLSTTREISANTAQLLRTMEEAAEVADYTTAATTDAQGNLQQMDRSMQQMVAATDSISAKLATLSEKASNINSVLATIVKVADQTNILSLNAAIEAEKAGEAGRGFAVVAIEIRRLADQTAVSTWDIEQMLKEMQSAVSASVMGMDKFTDDIRSNVDEMRRMAEQLSGMMAQISTLPPRFDVVLQGMQSQAQGASQIADTMNGLSEASQQTVDSLKATSEAVYQLKHAADDLQQSVSTFAVHT